MSDYHTENTAQAADLLGHLYRHIDDAEAEIARLKEALQVANLLKGGLDAQVKDERARADEAESKFAWLAEVIYNVLYLRDNVFYSKILRMFGEKYC